MKPGVAKLSCTLQQYGTGGPHQEPLRESQLPHKAPGHHLHLPVGPLALKPLQRFGKIRPRLRYASRTCS